MMLAAFHKLVGTEGTLKRETVVVSWALLFFVVVRLYVFTDPTQVHNFEGVTSTVFWALILLDAGIFGVQVMAPWLAGATPAKETVVETNDAKVTTKTGATLPKEEQE